MSVNKSLTDSEVQNLLRPLYGQDHCRSQVGFRRSLSLGFGEKVFHLNPKLKDSFYGTWEIGTYNCCWRFIRSGEIVLGSNDVVGDKAEMDSKFREIQLGKILEIRRFSDLDIKVHFDNGFIEFLTANSDLDENFHVFCPDDTYIYFCSRSGWSVGKQR